MARTATAKRGVEELLAAKEMVLVCGSGGVGKTTISAALGLAAVMDLDAKVLVLTVDPAKRLADSMGVQLGNRPTRVDPATFADAGVEVRGELWAAMLDTKAGWDELVNRLAPDAPTRTAVLENPLYQNITSRFVQSHDYLAMEQLHDFHASGDYDLVIVDTPPSRNALDVLDAPGRMVDFFGSSLLKWLTMPYRSRLLTAASKPFTQIADKILGSHFLRDIADFFVLFQRMEKGFVVRARRVEQLLADPRTTFVVVSTLEAAPVHEAAFLAAELRRRRFQLGAIVANRVLPGGFTGRAARASARTLVDESDRTGRGSLSSAVASELRADGAVDATVDRVAAVLGAVGRRFTDVAAVASAEAERRAELTDLSPVYLDVPVLDDEVHDLAGLAEIVEHLGT